MRVAILCLLAAAALTLAVLGSDTTTHDAGARNPRPREGAVRGPATIEDDLDDVLDALRDGRPRPALAGALDLLRRGALQDLPEERQPEFEEARLETGRWAVDEAEALAGAGEAAAATGLLDKADRVLAGLDGGSETSESAERTRRLLADRAAAEEAAARALAARPSPVDEALLRAKGAEAVADPAGALKSLKELLAATTVAPDRLRLEGAVKELQSTLVAREKRARVRQQADAHVRKGNFAEARKLLDGLVQGAAGDPTVSPEEAARDADREKGITDLEENAEPTALVAVRSGLRWMVAQALPDGSYGWTAVEAKEKGIADEKRATHPHRQGLTALVALALVGHARYDITDEFTAATDAALRWVASTQRADGSFPGDLYAHSLCTLVLVDADRLMGRGAYREQAARALTWLQNSQNIDGGWRYRARTPPSDISVTGWALQSLIHARYGGYEIRSDVLDGALAYVDRMTDPDGKVGYLDPGVGSNAMTAAALFCRLRLGQGTADPRVTQAADRLLRTPPKAGWKETSYHLFYASDAMSRLGGPYWEKWAPALKKFLLDSQLRKGDSIGAWPTAGDRWAEKEGTLYLAAMNCLSLENFQERR
jgi:hypothetical protein